MTADEKDIVWSRSTSTQSLESHAGVEQKPPKPEASLQKSGAFVIPMNKF